MPGRGFETQIGFAREATIFTPTWPSVAIAPATVRLPAMTWDLQEPPTLRQVAPRTRHAGAQYSDVTARQPSVAWQTDVYYDGMEVLWACGLGFMAKRVGTTVLPEQLGVGTYRHLYELDQHLEAEPWRLGDGFNLSGEIALNQHKVRRLSIGSWQNAQVVWEGLSFMLSQITFQGQAGQPLRCQVQGQGASVVQPATVNTSGGLAALSPLTGRRVLYQHACTAMRLGPWSTTTPLGAGDTISPTAMTLTISHGGRRQSNRRLGLVPDEPQSQGVVRVSGDIPLPRAAGNTYVQAAKQGTPYMCDMTWTGPIIPASGIARRFRICVPYMRFEQAETAIGGPGRTPERLHFVALEPPLPSAGFPLTRYTGACMLEIISTRSTHPLL